MTTDPDEAQRIEIRDEASRIHESAVFSAQGRFEATEAENHSAAIRYQLQLFNFQQ